jgi:4-methyl-5(b-hydroxyethyl)-thiazole monophosphate biosynthesis
MKKVLLLLSNGFEIYEASVFIDVFGWNNSFGTKDTKLFLCGLQKELNSSFGVKVEVDLLIDDIDPNEYEALAIPGGFEQFGFYEDAYSEKFISLIQKFHQLNKIISSICVGALPLGKSGILKNKNATTYNLMGGKRQKQLKEFGANIINEPIVKDENIITSWSPVTAIDVAFELLQILTSKENSEHIKGIMGFGNNRVDNLE